MIHNQGISFKFKQRCILQNPTWFTTSADNIYHYELKLSLDLCRDKFTSYLCAHNKSSTEFTCLPGNIRCILSLTRCLKKYWVIKVSVKMWRDVQLSKQCQRPATYNVQFFPQPYFTPVISFMSFSHLLSMPPNAVVIFPQISRFSPLQCPIYKEISYVLLTKTQKLVNKPNLSQQKNPLEPFS